MWGKDEKTCGFLASSIPQLIEVYLKLYGRELSRKKPKSLEYLNTSRERVTQFA